LFCNAAFRVRRKEATLGNPHGSRGRFPEYSLYRKAFQVMAATLNKATTSYSKNKERY
jgi:hypothetical protein